MKRVLSLVICLIMMTNIIPMSAFAISEAENSGEVDYPQYIETLEKTVNIEELKKVLYNAIYNCESSIDVTDFNISYTTENKDAIKALIDNKKPEFFHIKQLSWVYSAGIIIQIKISYSVTASEYQKMYSQFRAAGEALLQGIKDNENLDDVEMALLLHDRLAVCTEYDYDSYLTGSIPDESYTAYGALVNGAAVCEGYAEAYDYLLEQVGIECYITSSATLNHAWNIVVINGEKYHVDVTWDDPVWDTTGRVYHHNFLLSSDALYANKIDYKKSVHKGHVADDFDMSPVDTAYDNYYWQNSDAQFCLLGDEIYYIDSANHQIKTVSDSTVIGSVASTWRASSNSNWRGNYSRLATDGESIFYSLCDAVYKLDLITGTSSCVYQPDLSIGDWFAIYGFDYRNGYLVCDLNNTPNFDGNTKDNYQVKMFYDVQPPVASVTSTNNVSSSQTITLNMADNAGIAGYYWGTDSTYSNNPYTPTSDSSVTKQISDSGTYYLTVKDIANNVSQTKSIKFYKTTLNGNGATVTPSYIITASGNSFTFPTVSKDGFNYKGWSTSASAATGITSLAPTNNATYYAVFEEIPITVTSVEIINEPTKIVYYLGDTLNTNGLKLKVTYSDGSTQNVTSGFETSGFSSDATGNKAVTVTYAGKTAVFWVIVAETSILPGDVNGDSSVNSIDSNLLKRIVAGSILLEAGTSEFMAADYNGDGSVNAVDSNYLKRAISGQD